MVNYRLNEYFLESYLKPKPEHSDFYRIRPITAADMNRVNTAMKMMGDFNSYCSLYEIYEKNYLSILSYHSTIKSDFLFNRHRSYEYFDETSQEINRLLLNYLSSFKTFYDHFTTRYTKLERQGFSFYTDYEKITADCYDSSFSYRFFSKLRDYVQHCGLPLGEITIYEQLNQDGNVDIHVSTSFHRDSLLSSGFKWKKLKADLQSQPENMGLLLYLDKFHSKIKLINRLVTDFEISLATKSWQILLELVNEVQTQYPNGSPLIGKYIRTDSGQKRKLIINFPIHKMLKFEEKLRITNNLIYPTARLILNKAKLNINDYIVLQDFLTTHNTNEKSQ